MKTIFKNKAFMVVWIINIILAIADIVTTLRLGAISSILETNPIYRLTGSFIPIILLNFFIYYWFYFLYNRMKSKPSHRFFIIGWLIFMAVLRIVCIQNALSWEETTLTYEEIETMATPEVIKEQQTQMFTAFSVPLIVIVIVFFIWKVDHKVERKRRWE